MNRPWTHEDVLERLSGEAFFAAWPVTQGMKSGVRWERGAKRDETDGASVGTFDKPTPAELTDDEWINHEHTDDALKAELADSAALAHEPGRHAMLDAAAGRPDVLAALRRCATDLHRSVWLYIHHRELFERAWMLDLMQAQGYSAMQYRVGAGRPCLDDAALHALAQDASALFRRLYGRAERCVVRKCVQAPVRSFALFEPALRLIIDLADDLPPWARPGRAPSGAQLRYGAPRIEVVLDFAPATGVLRVVLPGKPQCHLEIARAFERLLLRRNPRCMPALAELNLQVLLQRLEAPDIVRDGFVDARLVSIELSRGNDATTILHRPPTGRAWTESAREAIVRDLGVDPIRSFWQVSAVTLALQLPDGHGAIDVDLRRNGRSNLYRFAVDVQARIEGYLIDLGVMDPHQALHAVLANKEIVHGEAERGVDGDAFNGDMQRAGGPLLQP